MRHAMHADGNLWLFDGGGASHVLVSPHDASCFSVQIVFKGLGFSLALDETHGMH